MKFPLVLVLLLSTYILYSQNTLSANPNNESKQKQSENLRKNRAINVTDQMADSLCLTPQQKNRLLSVNRSIEKQKAEVWKSTKDKVKIGSELQRIEIQRQRAYKEILTENQFKEYTRRHKVGAQRLAGINK
mgnify:CR=1 FL=1